MFRESCSGSITFTYSSLGLPIIGVGRGDGISPVEILVDVICEGLERERFVSGEIGR